jgi:hypothetical protein
MFTPALTRKCPRLARIVVGWYGWGAAECRRLVTMSHEYTKSATSDETKNSANALNQGGRVFHSTGCGKVVERVSGWG